MENNRYEAKNFSTLNPTQSQFNIKKANGNRIIVSQIKNNS